MSDHIVPRDPYKVAAKELKQSRIKSRPFCDGQATDGAFVRVRRWVVIPVDLLRGTILNRAIFLLVKITKYRGFCV